MIRVSQATTLPTELSRQVRERDQSNAQAVASTHFNRVNGQRSAVSQDGINQINHHLRSGFESYRGGHQVQQRTYEPEVDRVELSGRIRSINDNNRHLSQGSAVQLEARKPVPAAEMVSSSQALASKLRAAGPQVARATQAQQISRASAERLLG